MNTVIRSDISNQLIHLTKTSDTTSAYDKLMKMLLDQKLFGSNTDIRGKYKCICFSEAPISAISLLIASRKDSIRYAPFGIMFDKDYLFQEGARPVLYQTESEFKYLPEEIKYKHVKFDLTEERSVDWTWEREWRLRIDELQLYPSTAKIILPNRDTYHKFVIEYQMKLNAPERRIMGDIMQIDWHYIILEDLGFKIEG